MTGGAASEPGGTAPVRQGGPKLWTNAELAGFVSELADLMALDGASGHRATHYRRASTAIRRFQHSLAELIAGGTDLTGVPGIGKGLAGVLGDLVRHGASPRLEGYRKRIPAGLVKIMRLDGVGATKARTLRDAGVDTVAGLEAALASRELRRLDGFGPGVVSRLRRSLAARAALVGRSLLPDADRAVERVVAALEDAGLETRVAGDIRRRVEIVESTDIVCAGSPEALWDAAARLWDAAARCGGAGMGGARGDNPVQLTLGGVGMRLVAAPAGALDAVAHHLTGPPAYIEALAARARSRGLELTPTGVASDPRGDVPSGGGGGETAIYGALGLPWIAPELRDDARTIKRAAGGVPSLVTPGDIRGDFHMHTTWSDGAATLRRMVEAAARRRYAYVAITDHSVSTGVPGGLDTAALRAQAAEIAGVQEDLPGIRILRGCEVDILPDGSLDLEDEILAELDVVLVSVHSAFDMTETRMTDRIIKAMRNPLVHILCHPTGRKLGRRAPYPVDVPELLRAAAALGVAVEVNGIPRRLDIDSRGLWLCGELGVKVVVSSDAHSVASLGNMRRGVDQARRGWLQPGNIVNALALDDVMTWIDGRRGP